ncbi:SpoIIE family protein phosphatase [Leptospira licerasiae]|uniref:Stage II sporulation protein E n=1 Tax=Leptospira licerasiae str. MMD4847 TaxID=1049971 RepID=A0ABP2RC72_9LEPT|nr:SpoIIE family protein phosphatase [Leptospira licerasiae]EIE02615.1 PAS domain S-box / stage II sporulation protein E multi-domain protein [Leptospira licerasiae serovar Varillal str. VAR 010]EJZ40862.1 stage II sporulation protein E [Leptospira licerasiae str. MMD4847]
MNPYLILPLFALFINLWLFTYVLALKGKHKVVHLYLLYSGALSLWIISIILYWSFLPLHWMTWIFKISSISWLLVGPLFLEFVFAFLSKNPNIVLYLLRGLALAIFPITLTTDWIVAGVERKYWGDMLIQGPFYVYGINLLTVSPPVYAIYLLIFESRKEEIGFRKQCYLLAFGTFLSSVLGFLTTVLPRILSQGDLHYPPLSGSVSVIQSACVFIAIAKYGFLEIRLEKIALQLYSKLREGVILLSASDDLLYWNESAKEMLGFPKVTAAPEKLDLGKFLEGFTRRPFSRMDFKRKFSETKRIISEEDILPSSDSVYLEVSKSEIPISGRDLGKVYVLRDITEKKEASERINMLYSRVIRDLDIAREVQNTITTRDFPSSPKYKIFSYFRPYDRVGGDVLNCSESADGSLEVLFADVSGHGISSAMVAAMASISFNVFSRKGNKPKEGLLFTNDLLSSVVTQHFISAVFLRYNPNTKILEYSYAGHHVGLLLRDGQTLDLQGKGGVLLAVGTPILEDFQIQLRPGDRVLLYSDGLFEVRGSKGIPMGNSTLVEAVKKLSYQDSDSLIRSLVSYSESFGDGIMTDDLTLFCLEIRD